MTAFNAARFIDKAIESILKQTYPNIKLVIIDDGSVDTTWKKIQRYAKRYKRVFAYRLRTNSGPSEASNYGMSRATGKYIARMDADDIAYPTRIELQVAHMEAYPNVVLLGGQCDIINEQGEIIGGKRFPTTHEEIKNSLFYMNPIAHPACMYRRATYRKARLQYEKKYFISHDLKIIFRLLQFGKIENMVNTLLQYRHRPNSITHNNPKRAFSETVEIRHWALTSGIYHPSAYGLLVHAAQVIIVTLLPNMLINKLFILWRIKPIDEIKKAATQIAINVLPTFFMKPFMSELK